ncbi:MAG: NAD(+) kinase [Pseudomonadota bacterium]|nr:NAD(+) kinase [Pseudomonadota bacterium]
MNVEKIKFNNILIFARKKRENIIKVLQDLEKILHDYGYSAHFESKTEEIFKAHIQNSCNNLDLNKIDLVIVVGGDGTILQATKIAVENDIPLLGINCGRIGFLSDLRSNDVDSLINILNGEYTEEKRFMLSCDLVNSKGSSFIGNALNEVALMRGNLVKIIEFDIYINNKFVCNQRADGLLVSTPTGSTAYSLSAGGPIVQPCLETISLVPMCAHTLNTRPIVIAPDNLISIKTKQRHSCPPNISYDGNDKISINEGSYINISKAKQHLRLIHPRNYHYFETLKNKLHWERKPYAEFSAD